MDGGEPIRARALGIDVGGTKIMGVVMSEDEIDRPIVRVKVPTPRGDDELVDAIDDTIRTLRASLERLTGSDHIDAAGFGIPGLVDLGGVLRYGPNVPGVINLDLASRLRSLDGTPMVVGNDATAATWAEFRVGAAVGSKDMVLVTLGTGIGGGLVIGGKLVHGANGFAGEPGHMVIDPSGPLCACGRNGCWESFASGTALARLARTYAEAGRANRVVELAGGDIDSISGEHVTHAAEAGDKEATAIMVEFAYWLSVGIANLVNIFDPEVVVVGGGLTAAGYVLFQPLRAAYRELVVGVEHRPPVRILPARLGEQANAIGAGLLGLELLDGGRDSQLR